MIRTGKVFRMGMATVQKMPARAVVIRSAQPCKKLEYGFSGWVCRRPICRVNFGPFGIFSSWRVLWVARLP